MHSENGSRALLVVRKKLVAFHCARHDVAHERVALGELRREVHLLPLVALFYSKPWEAKITPNGIGPHKVNLAVCRKGSATRKAPN